MEEKKNRTPEERAEAWRAFLFSVRGIAAVGKTALFVLFALAVTVVSAVELFDVMPGALRTPLPLVIAVFAAGTTAYHVIKEIVRGFASFHGIPMKKLLPEEDFINNPLFSRRVRRLYVFVVNWKFMLAMFAILLGGFALTILIWR